VLITAAGNLLVIFVILCNRKMRNDVNFFLVNLAIADLCVGIFCIMPNLYLYISQYWLIGRVSSFTIQLFAKERVQSTVMSMSICLFV